MISDSSSADVLIAGGGPAGRALGARCAERGLSVTVVDVHPRRVWTPTYSAWADELPAWLDDAVVASRIENPAVRTHRTSSLDRTYCVLNTPLLQSFLTPESVQFRAARVRSLTSNLMICEDGTRLTGGIVVDARGAAPTPRAAQQSAFGMVVDRAAAQPVLDGYAAWFMDWRSDNGTRAGDPPSFLYAVPLDDDRFLLEETCLVGRPPLALGELERRLRVRLTNRGCVLPAATPIERVRFTVDGAPPPRRGEVLRFGAGSGLMHPGTGYSVASALAEADAVADAISTGSDPGRVLWPRSARTVARLRRIGVNALLTLEHDDVPTFFERFFSLSTDEQRVYLSGRRDAAATATVMAALFRSSPWRVRRTLMAAPFRGRAEPRGQVRD